MRIAKICTVCGKEFRGYMRSVNGLCLKCSAVDRNSRYYLEVTKPSRELARQIKKGNCL
jgi:hypothetical protein